MDEYLIVFITVGDKEEADRISKALVQEKIAACVNIVTKVNSVYWWKGKIEEGEEILLVVKTKKSLFERLKKSVKDIHSYEVPEIIAMQIVEGDEEYLRWIDESSPSLDGRDESINPVRDSAS